MNLETIDWMTVGIVGFAAMIFLGGMLMMFTGIWTSRDR
jgi:hypothetical protein